MIVPFNCKRCYKSKHCLFRFFVEHPEKHCLNSSNDDINWYDESIHIENEYKNYSITFDHKFIGMTDTLHIQIRNNDNHKYMCGRMEGIPVRYEIAGGPSWEYVFNTRKQIIEQTLIEIKCLIDLNMLENKYDFKR